MKKTILIAFLLGCLTTFASAEMKAGISITGYDLDADGKESNINPTEGDKSESADIMGVTASVFIVLNSIVPKIKKIISTAERTPKSPTRLNRNAFFAAAAAEFFSK